MSIWSFPTKIIFGAGEIQKLGQETAALGVSRVLVVADAGVEKNGLLNALITSFGGQSISFLHTPGLNTLAMIIVGVWMYTGFCMTVLAAALRGVPAEILESARTDGYCARSAPETSTGSTR